MCDADGQFVARCVYEEMFKGDREDLDADDVAYGLDKAVQKLRASGAPASRWAPYVHFGT